jgi:ATP-dependent protease HslVU (ClpYQ) peptidase subunit
MESRHGATILAVRKNGKAAIAGDRQVSLQSTVKKPKRAAGASGAKVPKTEVG